MKSRLILFLSVVPLTLLLLLQLNAKSYGQINSKLKIIENPAIGKWDMAQKGKIKFEEKYKIGVLEGDTTQLFSYPQDVTVDMKANIYISDIQECNVKKYNENGDYILTFGRRGQGPGEFTVPWSIHTINDEILIFDKGNLRVNKFKTDGSFIKSFSLKFKFEDAIIDHKGNFYIHHAFNGKLIHKLDPNGEYLISFMDEIEPEMTRIKPHLNSGKITIKPDNEMLLVLPYPFSLYFFSERGEMLKKVINNKIPDAKPPFVDDSGAVLVLFGITDVSIWDNYIFVLAQIIKKPDKIDEKWLMNLESAIESHIYIFDREGNYLSHVDINNYSTGATLDKKGNYLLLGMRPFPHLISYTIHFPYKN